LKKLWLKVVLVVSLDGRIAPANGEKAHIGGQGDREVLEEALAWADATIMGGETLRVQKSTCLIHKEALIQKRIEKNKTKQPIALVLSNKSDHSSDLEFFKQSIHRWLISSKITLDDFINIEGYERLIPFQKDYASTLNELYQIGLRKIVVLGGAQVIASLLKENQIDELQLTISPQLLGGKYSWIPYEMNCLPINFNDPRIWKLKENKILCNNEIMVKYINSNSESYTQKE
tara:strand:+ start:67 stop:762 length:696 start_codon:yes stop_codon:yes gene_type:complete